MTREENECCNCKTGSYPCRGSSCGLRHVIHYYCDECGDEIEDSDGVIRVGNKELCLDCGYRQKGICYKFTLYS